ncbi:MAG: hypothetical protein HQ567_27655 [Candidatus Nealsonbacteria bacterium]|nr:hypothetical protein [Candidatus Nealsonbacteria bacterium]
MSESERIRASNREQDRNYGTLHLAMAWGVHLLTASGIVCCLLAMEAGWTKEWRSAFAWLTLAVMIDAVDGTLARLARVKEVLPNFDGTLLDNTIDYATFVFVPALLMHRAGLLPEQLSLWMAAAVCVTSAFQFCQADAKTPDHFFKGFPSYWNITVLYLMALGLDATTNLAIVGLLIVLVFVPVKYLYPSRTPHFQKCTIALTSAWGVMIVAIIWQLPEPWPWLVHASLLYVAYYFAMSLFLTFQGRRERS